MAENESEGERREKWASLLENAAKLLRDPEADFDNAVETAGQALAGLLFPLQPVIEKAAGTVHDIGQLVAGMGFEDEASIVSAVADLISAVSQEDDDGYMVALSAIHDVSCELLHEPDDDGPKTVDELVNPKKNLN
jgi:hypothetical protein